MSETAPEQGPIEPHRVEPYVFICYSHQDTARVLPHIQFLQGDGIDVWYDRGIAAGAIWRRRIDEELEKATHLVFFVSHASLHSRYCEGEVHDALDHNKTVVPVFLEDTPLTQGMRVALSRVQALYGHSLSDDALNDQLRGAIRSAGSALPTAAPFATVPNRRSRSRQRARFVWAAAALATVVAIGSGVWWSSRTHATPVPTRSIAVLPFTPMSEDAAIRHLANTFVEELLNDLTAQRQFKVEATPATKPSDQGLPAFVAALGVSYVVEGSMRPSSDGDRVTAQLIRGSDGVHLLSQTFELGRDHVDIDAVASRVALNAFRYVDNDVEIAQARTQTTNGEAFAHYEKAFRLDPSGADTGTSQAGWDQQLINLDKAIGLDPGFAEPYFVRSLVPDPAKARRMIDRYLQLRPDSAKGITRLGLLQFGDGDLAAAERSFKHAHELEPELPWPLSCLGHLAMWRGRAQEAADYYKQSTVNDAAKPNHFFYGVALMALEQFDEADRQFELDLRISPDHLLAMSYRVQVAHLRGRDVEAKERFDAAWAKYGKVAPAWFIQVLPMMGHEQDLRDRMKQWDAGTIPAPTMARFVAYNALQEYDAAIDWLLRALDEGIGEQTEIGPFIRLDKLYPGIHKHPRYAEVAAKLDAKEVTH